MENGQFYGGDWAETVIKIGSSVSPHRHATDSFRELWTSDAIRLLVVEHRSGSYGEAQCFCRATIQNVCYSIKLSHSPASSSASL